MRKILLIASFLISSACAWDANAKTLNIVALGASNTLGRGIGAHSGGVSKGEAYPAQLEPMLRAKGYDAHVANAGVAADTSGGLMSRMSSDVPNGTQIVILQYGGNDARKGQGDNLESNIGAITSALKARGIKVIPLDMRGRRKSLPASTYDPDGQHYNAQGHALIAAGLLPRVIAAAGRP